MSWTSRQFTDPLISRRSLVSGYSYTGLMIVLYLIDHPETVERLVQLGPVPIKFGTKYPPNLAASDKPGKAKALRRLHELQRKNYPTTNPQEYCEQEWAYTRFGLVGNAANVAELRIVTM